jgi:putative iron-dependent peroxidase
MAAPQPGILMEEKAHALFLVLRARTGVNGRALLRACAKAPRLCDVVARRDKKAALRCTVAFGRRLLESAAGSNDVPKQFHEFVPIRTVGGEVPRTPADVLFHIGSNRHDLNFELARTLLAKVGELVSVEEEVAGFRYLDGRDLTGFIDGTANPKGRVRAEAALIGPEDKSFAGGSFVLIQRYVHNLAAWSRLSQRDQEAAIGRTKKDSIELPGNRKLPTAHISRVEINGPDGAELKIVRHSFPYGVASGENGLFFIAYAKDSAIFQAMLARMFGASKDGLSDRLMDFTKPLTGAILFAPSLAMLRQMAR